MNRETPKIEKQKSIRMKHLQLFEDYSSAPAAGAKDQQIAKMIQEATNDFNFRTFSDWDEEKIKDAFLMIKT